MKFQFRNIGPIREAELELGDLTIIAGRNNTGKTYLAYSLYGFLKSVPGWPGFRDFLLDEGGRVLESDPVDVPTLRRMARALAQTGEARRTVAPATLARERAAVVEAVSEQFSKGLLASVFSAPADQFEGAALRVAFEEEFPETISPETLAFSGFGEYTCGYDGDEVRLRSVVGSPGADRGPSIFPHLYGHLLLHPLPNPFVLSAERFGISLFYKELDFTKNKLVELLQEIQDGKHEARFSPYVFIDKTTSRYALPIKDNIDYTRGLSEIGRGRSAIHDDKLFDSIKDMLDGYFRASDDELRFISKRRKDARFDIPLYRASSSARGLSDLYFYLKHVARRNHLLIVDEPESHLDTENQVALAGLLSAIVGSGIRVLVTTHSDYLIKELNNLIMRAELNHSGNGEAESTAAEPGLPAERVRAYVTERGGLSPCTVDHYGMDIPMFDKTIDDINRRSRTLAARVTQARENGS